MWTDPIITELHLIREEHAKRFEYDLQAIFDDLKQQEQQSGLKYVILPIKRRVANNMMPPRKRMAMKATPTSR